MRHVDVGILWLQHKWLKKIIGFHKMPGSENTADMMTKALNREKGDQFVRDMNAEFRKGRAGKAVRLQGEISAIRIVRGEDKSQGRAKTVPGEELKVANMAKNVPDEEPKVGNKSKAK